MAYVKTSCFDVQLHLGIVDITVFSTGKQDRLRPALTERVGNMIHIFVFLKIVSNFIYLTATASCSGGVGSQYYI